MTSKGLWDIMEISLDNYGSLEWVPITIRIPMSLGTVSDVDQVPYDLQSKLLKGFYKGLCRGV